MSSVSMPSTLFGPEIHEKHVREKSSVKRLRYLLWFMLSFFSAVFLVMSFPGPVSASAYDLTHVTPYGELVFRSYRANFSANGEYLSFDSNSTPLVPGGLVWSGCYLMSRGGAIRLLTHSYTGGILTDGADNGQLSADGTSLAFRSRASNVIPSGNPGMREQVWLCSNGVNDLVSHAMSGLDTPCNAHATPKDISADGTRVLFESLATDLVPNATEGINNTFVYDSDTGDVTQVNVASDGTGANSDGWSTTASISDDGEWVAFASDADNLVPGDTNGCSDIFLHSMTTGVTTRISLGPNQTQANAESYNPCVSSDGGRVSFESSANNLVSSDTNEAKDIFVWSASTNTVSLVSYSSAGNQAGADSYDASLSGDGQILVYVSDADNLIAGDTNGMSDIFVHYTATGQTKRVPDSGGGGLPSLSADGRCVAWEEMREPGDPYTILKAANVVTNAPWLKAPVLGFSPTSNYTNDPVNTANGNATYSVTDLTLPGLGLSLAFTRTYNSSPPGEEGVLGFGWTHNYSARLDLSSPDFVALVRADRSRVYFPLNSSGAYDSPEGVTDRLSKNPDGSFTLTGLDQSREQYDVEGRLSGLFDRYGNETTLTYDAGGQLSEVEEPGGRTLTFSYTDGHITSIEAEGIPEQISKMNIPMMAGVDNLVAGVPGSDFHGGSLSSWDGTQFVPVTEDDMVAGVGYRCTPSSATSATVNLVPGPITVSLQPGSNLVGNATAQVITLPQGYVASVYDPIADDYVSTSTLEPGQGGWIEATQAADIQLGKEDESASRSVTFTYTDGELTSVTDPNGHVTTYGYDSYHRITTLRQPEASTEPFITNTYTDDKVTLQSDALGNETVLAYDTDNQQTTITDARNNTSIDHWDGTFRLISQTDPYEHYTSISYNSRGFPQSVTDQNGHETTYTYDSLGNMISAIDPEGHETKAEHDTDNGNPLWAEDAAGNRTTYHWDPSGLFLDMLETPIGETSFTWNPDGTLGEMTDANSHSASYEYNTHGDLTRVTDPLGFQTHYAYDAAGRVTSLTDANGSGSRFAYDEKGNVTSIRDALAIIDPSRRHQIDFTYDDNDNLIEIRDANENETAFTYDDMNHLSGVKDALGGEAAYTYDGNYNLTSAEGPNGHVTTYAYDDNDRISSVSDPLSKVTGYSYDPVGNLTSVIFPSGDETHFTYTDDNLLEEISRSGDPTTYTYSYNPTHTVSQVERNDGKTWAYTYDDGSRLTSESDENNSALGTLAIGRTYDDVSKLTGLDIGTAVALGLTYDARNLLATFTDPGGTSTFTHDDGGRLTEIETPEGSTRSLTYDAASQITQNKNATTSDIDTLTYTYDGNGNVLSENDTEYEYDALNRLISWYDPGADATTEYVYDAAGNLTEVKEDSVTTETYTYNAGDQITNAGYLYDDNGNLTADGTYTYLYDADNQLTEVKQGQTTIASMTYDFLGRRTSLTIPAGTTYFHYAGGFLVAESGGNGDITVTYAYSPEGGLLSMTRGADTYYYQTNAHGDVVSLTDETGTVVNTYTYDPWGKPVTTSETVTNPFRYAGYYYDEATDLYYLWHRYYDPGLRRFSSPDLVFGSLTNPACLNSYLYALNNPTSMADSMGLFPSAGEIYEFFVAGPARELQRWISYSGQYVPLTQEAEESAAYYRELGEGGSWLWNIPAWLADRWSRDNWAWTAAGLKAGWKTGAGTVGSTTAKAKVCPAATKSGIVAQNGTTITGYTKHGINRATGNGFERAGTSPQAIFEALKNPKTIKSGVDDLGRPFEIFTGPNARVVVNPQTGEIVSVNPLGVGGVRGR